MGGHPHPMIAACFPRGSFCSPGVSRLIVGTILFPNPLQHQSTLSLCYTAPFISVADRFVKADHQYATTRGQLPTCNIRRNTTAAAAGVAAGIAAGAAAAAAAAAAAVAPAAAEGRVGGRRISSTLGPLPARMRDDGAASTRTAMHKAHSMRGTAWARWLLLLPLQASTGRFGWRKVAAAAADGVVTWTGGREASMREIQAAVRGQAARL